jgi:hypothetical protein
MNKYNPIGLYFVLGGVVAFVFADARVTMQPQSFEKLEGNLYHSDIPEMSKANAPLPRPESYLPHVTAYLENMTAIGIPENAKSFVVDISKDPKTSVKWGTTVESKQTISALTPNRAVKHGRPSKAVIAAAPPATVPVHAVTAEVPLTPAAPVRPHRDTFNDLDETLSNNLLSFPISRRIAHGDVSVQLEQLGKFDAYYLLKFSVANNEGDEFFLSKVVITTDKTIVPSKDAMPFSCQPGKVIYGIVKFPVSDVANRHVSFALTESGSGARKFEIRGIAFAF